MRLTRRTNLALRALMFCAVNDGRIVRKQDVAELCNVSENHLAQVVNGLSRKGFITTLRGRHGGFRLARPMKQINIGDVTRQFEGGVPLTECFAAGPNHCPLSEGCRLRGALQRAVEAFYATLDELTLADMVECNVTLHHILSLPDVLPRCSRALEAAQ